MDGRRSTLGPVHMQTAMGKIHSSHRKRPAPKPGTRGDRRPRSSWHRGGITVIASGHDQAGDLDRSNTPASGPRRCDGGRGPALVTVPLTVVGETSARCDFPMFFRPLPDELSRYEPLWDRGQEAFRPGKTTRVGGRAWKQALLPDVWITNFSFRGITFLFKRLKELFSIIEVGVGAGRRAQVTGLGDRAVQHFNCVREMFPK